MTDPLRPSYQIHLERDCECPQWPSCVGHRGGPDTCDPHEHRGPVRDAALAPQSDRLLSPELLERAYEHTEATVRANRLSGQPFWVVFAAEYARLRLLAALAAEARPGLDEGCTCEPEHVWPCALIPRCDEPGCERETTCGWPSATGYRRTCGEHWQIVHLTEDRP